jgi:hypothetical protein
MTNAQATSDCSPPQSWGPTRARAGGRRRTTVVCLPSDPAHLVTVSGSSLDFGGHATKVVAGSHQPARPGGDAATTLTPTYEGRKRVTTRLIQEFYAQPDARLALELAWDESSSVAMPEPSPEPDASLDAVHEFWREVQALRAQRTSAR